MSSSLFVGSIVIMGKQIIELIGELVEISGNPFVDGIIFFVIEVVSFSVAFGLVGKIFDALGFYDSDIMSDVHWLIRVVVFCGLTYMSVKVVQFITWLFSFQWWVYLIAGVIVVTAIVLVYWLRYNYRLRKNVTLVDNEKLTQNNCTDVEKKENACANENAIQIVSTYSRYCCPRCNSKLVKRHGPYGDFYGCEAYAQTGCRYTRKYL